MADRMLNQFAGTFEKGVVSIFIVLTFGGTGAVTLTRGKGVASCTRTSQGLYVITLQDKYRTLLGFAATWLHTSAPAAALVNIKAETVASDKTITFNTMDADSPAITDPDSGSLLYIRVDLSNSSAL